MTDSRSQIDELQTRVSESDHATDDATPTPFETHLCDMQRLEGLGVLARAIAHDFNNQLTVILGNCSLAQADLDPASPLQQRLARVRVAAQHSAGLTEQLLNYSGSLTDARKPIHLPHLLESLNELLDAAMGKRCELVIEGPPQLPLIEGDETQMQQLIVNLVTNAAESLGHATGHAWLRFGVVSADEQLVSNAIGADGLPEADYVYLEIEDDGSGIAPDDRARVFEPFFTSRSPGRGLGLTAALEIARSHGGAILLDSVPGQGTKVRVLLPKAGTHRQSTR